MKGGGHFPAMLHLTIFLRPLENVWLDLSVIHLRRANGQRLRRFTEYTEWILNRMKLSKDAITLNISHRLFFIHHSYVASIGIDTIIRLRLRHSDSQFEVIETKGTQCVGCSAMIARNSEKYVIPLLTTTSGIGLSERK